MLGGYLSEAGEQDVDPQGPHCRRLHQGVLTVGQAQQHRDAHHLDLILHTPNTQSVLSPQNTHNLILHAIQSHNETKGHL